MSNNLSKSKGLPIESYLTQILNLYDIEDSSAKIPINLYLTEHTLSRFLSNTKSQIRGSLEYKFWVKWFRETYGPEICCVTGNIVSIEVHHHPLVLEDYVDLIFLYLYNNNIAFTTSLISDLVLRLHYENIIGGCYMSNTAHIAFHELHNIEIPEEAVRGDFEKLIKHPILGDLITPNMKAKMCNYIPNFCSKHKDYFYK